MPPDILPEGARVGKTDRGLQIAWGLLAVAAIAIAVIQGLRFMTRDMIDFTVMYRVGERILHGRAIYDFSDGMMLFKYAPITGYVLAPLALLPKSASAFVFFLLSVASFALCFQWAYRWVMPRGAGGWAGFLVAALALLSTLRVIMNSLDFGQVQVFLLLGMLTSARGFESRKWLRGGLALALVALCKIVPAVLCMRWLMRRQWRPALATAGLSLLLLAAPALWLGPARAAELTGQWWNLLGVSTNQAMIEKWTNQSLLSALTRLFVPNHYHVNWFGWSLRAAIILNDALLVLWLCGIAWLGLRRKENKFPSAGFAGALDLSYYLLFIILAFPLAWRYHFTSLILPNMVILSYLLCYARRDYLVWGLFLAAFFLGSVVNQEILGSRLFEWFHVRSCLTLSVLVTSAALLRIDLLSGNSIAKPRL